MYLGTGNMILALILGSEAQLTLKGQLNLTFFAVLTENRVILTLRVSSDLNL